MSDGSCEGCNALRALFRLLKKDTAEAISFCLEEDLDDYLEDFLEYYIEGGGMDESSDEEDCASAH